MRIQCMRGKGFCFVNDRFITKEKGTRVLIYFNDNIGVYPLLFWLLKCQMF